MENNCLSPRTFGKICIAYQILELRSEIFHSLFTDVDEERTNCLDRMIWLPNEIRRVSVQDLINTGAYRN